MTGIRKRLNKAKKINYNNTSKSTVALPKQRLLNNKGVKMAGTTTPIKRCVVRLKRTERNIVTPSENTKELKRCVVRIKRLGCLKPNQTNTITVQNLEETSSNKKVQFTVKKRKELIPSAAPLKRNGYCDETRQCVRIRERRNIQKNPVKDATSSAKYNVVSNIQCDKMDATESSRPGTNKNHKARKNSDSITVGADDKRKRRECPTQNIDNAENSPSMSRNRDKIYATKNITKQKTVQKATKRSSRRTNGIYDFPLESPVSIAKKDQQSDAANDIIQRMINDGKVAVATLIKGRGKTRLKPIKKKMKIRPIGKRKKCSLDEIGKQTTIPASALPLMRKMTPVYETDQDYNNFDNDYQENDIRLPTLSPDVLKQLGAQGKPQENQTKNLTGDVNRLNQTNHITVDRRKLLDMARRIVSTPINKKPSTITEPTSSLHTTILSPIAPPMKHYNRQRKGIQSPWRVPDEAALPNTFNFGLNNSNLPSFSSDFMTTSMNISRKDCSNVENFIPPAPVKSVRTSFELGAHTESYLPSTNNTLCIGQQSPSNDSDGENIAPHSPLAKKAKKSSSKEGRNVEFAENEGNENFVHLPNPRRTLRHRSPLKPINILEVVVLPSWKQNDEHIAAKNKISKNKNTTEDIHDGQPPTVEDNLFGFNDFLNDFQSPLNKRYSGPNSDNNCTLRERLHNLKELRPCNEELPVPVTIPVRCNYDGLEAGRSRQPTIKQLLCSTMIYPEAELNKVQVTPASQTTVLFKDPDPETTFDDKQPHQTYVRPKRKRKRRHEFLLFLDSDESEVEEDSREESIKDAHKTHKKKKQKNENTQTLDEFVTSFNAMCKEVEEYEIQVE